MTDSTSNTINNKVPSIQDDKIVFSEEMNIQQAVNDLASLSRQSLHINYIIEDLAAVRTDCTKHADKLYDLVFQISTNLERMKAVSSQLDEMNLTERKPVISTANNDVLGHAYKITSLAKPLADWLMMQPAAPEDNGTIDLNSGDCLELACSIVSEANAIVNVAQGVK